MLCGFVMLVLRAQLNNHVVLPEILMTIHLNQLFSSVTAPKTVPTAYTEISPDWQLAWNISIVLASVSKHDCHPTADQHPRRHEHACLFYNKGS